MNRVLLATALAPLIWGSTYLLTSSFLAGVPAPLLSVLRILPAGLLLLLAVRRLPPREWWLRIGVLALLRQGLFFTLLYAAAQSLPGGVAATIGASSSMLVLGLAFPLLGQRPSALHLGLASAGLLGVALVSLGADAALSGLGLLYALGFAFVNALGVVLFKRWGWPAGATPLQQASWELTLGGLMLLPLSLGSLQALASVTAGGWAALAFLTLIGTALTAWLWQRGLNLLPVQQVSLLGPLSPLMALGLDLLIVRHALSPAQAAGALLILGSVILTALPARHSLKAAPSA
ncbi:EamA family transporter [Deinococcus koreensis]|uniref:EamA family transporter n=1 Tax=Deinococcus koreensis TaxID=2054903 RepID=A0A2K3V093_9DEIO|nr:EamA family transporter [Deinococcus koreensis]PNY82195.1 EamA family transporter [Deinococcus koreensis]